MAQYKYNFFIDRIAGKDGWITLYYNADIEILIPRDNQSAFYLHFTEYPEVVEYFPSLEKLTDFVDRCFRLELLT
jgi:hypothetical protein